jgi:hypothetical protein
MGKVIHSGLVTLNCGNYTSNDQATFDWSKVTCKECHAASRLIHRIGFEQAEVERIKRVNGRPTAWARLMDDSLDVAQETP